MAAMRPPGPDPVAALARSGLMALTGWPDSAPRLPPVGLPARLERLTGEIERRTRARGQPVRVGWEAAISGRAALLGLTRHGRTAANGSCQLLATRDGWVGLNLSRPDDAELLPALIGGRVTDPWQDAATAAARTSTTGFVAQARLLGLAASPLIVSRPRRPLWRAEQRWPPATAPPLRSWRVVDLSSLWAGPVVGRILSEAGAQVTKVESETRPDGARANPIFYRWVHPPGEASVRLDFRSPTGRAEAADLIDAADVVIEASRPRALEQLGLGPHDRPSRPGRVWLSITGHGRSVPGRDWVAFGDDAAVAGGLVGWDADGGPVFCGDAIADPIAGLAGAVAVLRALDAGGGKLIDLSMSRVAGAMAAGGTEAGAEAVRDGSGRWLVGTADRRVEVQDRPRRVDWIERG
jgi:CoA-transferase family III